MLRLSESRPASIPVEGHTIIGDLAVPPGATGIVMFAHGSGSSRHSPRNRSVAEFLNEGHLGTLLIDLLTDVEEAVDMMTSHLRFDIELLSERLVAATDWVGHRDTISKLPLGYFGASTGAAAALVAAGRRADQVNAVVSRGGRPDLAKNWLTRVEAPTLLIVGEHDEVVLELNREAARKMHAFTRIEIVPRATHLFEEIGALERVASLSRDWFQEQFARRKAA